MTNFDFKNFNWKEATSNEAGQSSSALFVCFWFGLCLIWFTFVVSILMVINAFYKLEVDFAVPLTFIGVNFGVVMTYLGARNFSNNKVKIETNGTTTT